MLKQQIKVLEEKIDGNLALIEEYTSMIASMKKENSTIKKAINSLKKVSESLPKQQEIAIEDDYDG